jgi:hypothetical protein
VVKNGQENMTELNREIYTSDKTSDAADEELKGRHVASIMIKTGKIRDLRNRRQIAENLGRILSKRKSRLNLSELVVSAGISENPDPSRLGRYRILPGKKSGEATILRLSQEAVAYVRLIKETAKITGEHWWMLIQELVLGTKFDPSGLEGIEIEPFEQLHTLIQKKLDVLDAKFDLVTYFQTIKNHSLLPIWSHGPKYNGRVAVHHSADRPQIIGWEKDPNPFHYRQWRYQAMPIVPLCRIRRKKRMYSASIKSGDFKDVDGDLSLYYRCYLSVGMFDGDFSLEEVAKSISTKDAFPIPYIILVDEFQYWPSADAEIFDPLYGTFRRTIPGGPASSGGGREPTVIRPLFFYDDSAEFEIVSMESEYIMEPDSETDSNQFWYALISQFEQINRLDLVRFRRIFGMSMSNNNSNWNDPLDGIETFSNEDALDKNQLVMTLAPRGTIAELMEANLVSSSNKKSDNGSDSIPTFLDKLEEDTKLMTSSLEEFMETTRSNLNKKHESLIENFDREIKEAQVKE